MRTLWRRGESSRDDILFWRGAAVLVFYFGGVWNYAAVPAADDDPVWGVLFCLVGRRNDRGELGDVADQALSVRLPA